MSTTKRPFITHYFITPNASGMKPSATGYAASLQGARRNMAVRIVLGQYGLAVVKDRHGGHEGTEPLCIMRRTPKGLTIKEGV